VRIVEIESLAEFDGRVTAGARSARGWRLQSVDLRERREELAALDVSGSVFLGCRFPDDDSELDVRRRGGLVFPAVPDVPFDPYRSSLYSATELYDGLERSYDATPDARAFAWSHAGRTVDRTLASALHDHAIDDALADYARGKRIVGVLGGHAAVRGSAGYREAAALGRMLGRQYTVATGGGPGAMEAANLGAWLSGQPDEDLDRAVSELSGVPDFAPDVAAWARSAMAVREMFPKGRDSLGVPTWFYGHEPPNVFAAHIAKYFANAVREDVLLRVCRVGLVFLPGAAGTVQEVFQSACENYYAGPADVAPMVLVGRRHWTEELPVWPLLSRMAEGRVMAPRVHLVDDLSDVLPLLGAPRET
jgi:predicted Rossmann-fold nucleotide-binding protein